MKAFLGTKKNTKYFLRTGNPRYLGGEKRVLVLQKIDQIWEVKVAQFWDWDWCASLQCLFIHIIAVESDINPFLSLTHAGIYSHMAGQYFYTMRRERQGKKKHLFHQRQMHYQVAGWREPKLRHIFCYLVSSFEVIVTMLVLSNCKFPLGWVVLYLCISLVQWGINPFWGSLGFNSFQLSWNNFGWNDNLKRFQQNAEWHSTAQANSPLRTF